MESFEPRPLWQDRIEAEIVALSRQVNEVIELLRPPNDCEPRDEDVGKKIDRLEHRIGELDERLRTESARHNRLDERVSELAEKLQTHTALDL